MSTSIFGALQTIAKQVEAPLVSNLITKGCQSNFQLGNQRFNLNLIGVDYDETALEVNEKDIAAIFPKLGIAAFEAEFMGIGTFNLNVRVPSVNDPNTSETKTVCVTVSRV